MDKFFLHFLICFNFVFKGIFKELFSKKSSKKEEEFDPTNRHKIKLNLAAPLLNRGTQKKKPRQEPSQNSHLGLITF